MKKYKPKSNYAIKPLIFMLVIITVSAVMIGYFGTRYIVYPIFLKNNSGIERVENNISSPEIVEESANVETPVKETSDSKPSLNSKEFLVYHVQLGNFTAKENADALIKELEEDGIFAYILEDEGFKVVTVPRTSYNQAESNKNEILNYAQDAFILKRRVHVDNVSVKTTIENILNDLNEAHTQKEIGEAWLTKLKGAFQDGLGDSQMEEKTIATFQKLYDEVNQIDNIQNNELFELEKMIIMKVEEIL